MSVRAFLDTNVRVYLFDSHVPAKRTQEAARFQSLCTNEYTPVVRTHVLQEACVALTRKLAIDPRDGQRRGHLTANGSAGGPPPSAATTSGGACTSSISTPSPPIGNSSLPLGCRKQMS